MTVIIRPSLCSRRLEQSRAELESYSKDAKATLFVFHTELRKMKFARHTQTGVNEPCSKGGGVKFSEFILNLRA